MTVALILLIVAIQAERKGLSIPWLALLAVVGAVALWFSHPSLFVMAPMGVGLAYPWFRKRDWRKIAHLSVVAMIWLVSFVLNYVTSLQALESNEFFKTSFSGAFMPIPPTSWSDVNRLFTHFLEIFSQPVGIAVTGLAGIAFVVGCYSMFSERRDRFFILISPIILTLLASALEKYPFGGRTILFLAPFFLLLVAEGIEYIRAKVGPISGVVAVAVIVILFYTPVTQAATQIKDPTNQGAVEEVVRYVGGRVQNGDVIYVSSVAKFGFQFYAEQYGMTGFDVLNSNEEMMDGSRYPIRYYAKGKTDLKAVVELLRGNDRVWLIYGVIAGEIDSSRKAPILLATSKSGTLLLRRDQGEMAVL